jgi:hypothetical protein
MPTRGGGSLEGRHRVGKRRRAVRHSPRQPHCGQQADGDADRFVQLVQLKQPRRKPFPMHHGEA